MPPFSYGFLKDDPSFSEAACSELTEYTYNSTWRSECYFQPHVLSLLIGKPACMLVEHFPAYQFTDSEFCGPTNSCNSTTLVSNQTCHQGRVPDYAVYAESSQDVVEYVRFATKHNLRIVIKNTGHDMLRRSSGKGGFAVWTHKMKGLEFHEHFVPEACHTVVDGGALTLSAGIQWAEVRPSIHIPWDRLYTRMHSELIWRSVFFICRLTSLLTRSVVI